MIKVKVSTGSPHWPWLRQTPGEKGIWGHCQFFVDQDVEECDYWIVYWKLIKKESTRCPPGNTLFITPEPAPIKTYDPRFLKQFAAVITCQREMDHPRKIYQQQAVNWFAGVRYDEETGQWEKVLDYDQFKAQEEIAKRKEISVLCSAKADTQGHLERIEFVNRLNSEFSGEIDVYGFGNRPSPDKWDAIAPYRYHIVIENSIYPDYWTEKLADAYLGRSYPFYYGCPNIGDYFPRGAYTTIDINDFERSVKVIRETIKEGYYENSLDSIQEARELVLDRYNLFAELSRWCQDQDGNSPAEKVTLLPEARITRPWYWPMRNVEKYVRQNTWGKWLGKGKGAPGV